MEPIFRKPKGVWSKKTDCEKRPHGPACKFFKISELSERLKRMPR